MLNLSTNNLAKDIYSMKLKKIVTVIPIITLASCTYYGKKITAEEALELSKDFVANQINTAIPFKTVKINMDSVDSSGKDNTKVTIKSSYYLEFNDKGNTYVKANIETIYINKTVIDYAEFYEVRDEEYEEIFYVTVYQDNKDNANTYAFTKKDSSSDYYNVTEQYENIFEYPFMTMLGFFNPTTIIESLNNHNDESSQYIGEPTYYSKGKGNLTIKISYKNEDAFDPKDEETIEGLAYAKYDEGLLKEIEADWTTSYENKSSIKAKLSYTDKYSIELPNGWETYLNK